MRQPYLGATDVLYCGTDGRHHAAQIIEVTDGLIVSLVVFPADRRGTQFQSRENVGYCGEEGVEGWKWNDAFEQTFYTAGQIISGHRIVTLTADQTLVYPDLAADSVDTDKLAGLAVNAGATGDSIAVCSSGPISESSWNWEEDKRLFLAANGQITQSVPQTGPIVNLGVALNATSIFLSIKPAIVRV